MLQILVWLLAAILVVLGAFPVFIFHTVSLEQRRRWKVLVWMMFAGTVLFAAGMVVLANMQVATL